MGRSIIGQKEYISRHNWESTGRYVISLSPLIPCIRYKARQWVRWCRYYWDSGFICWAGCWRPGASLGVDLGIGPQLITLAWTCLLAMSVSWKHSCAPRYLGQSVEDFTAWEHVDKPLVSYNVRWDPLFKLSRPSEACSIPCFLSDCHTFHFFLLTLEREKIASCHRLHSRFSLIVKKWANNQQ